MVDFIKDFVKYPEILGQALDAYSALVFGKIYRLSLKSGYSYASNKSMAKDLGLGLSTVIRAKNRLLEKELICDVTPKQFLSKKQVRYYSINLEKYNDFISNFEENKQLP